MKRRTLTVTAAAGLPRAAIRPARGQGGTVSDGVVKIGVVKIGVLDDMSGVFADQQDMGDVVSAWLAVEDFGGRVLGAPIELVFGDLQNRADVGMAIARRWYDQEPVDAILGIGNSAVALAVRQLTRETNRISIAVAAGTTDPTRRACSPLGVHWTYDNHALARGSVTAVMAKMRELPINDFMTRDGQLREDGRVVRDMDLMRARQPGETCCEWDLLEVIATIPGDEAFRPRSESEYPLLRGLAARRGTTPPPRGTAPR